MTASEKLAHKRLTLLKLAEKLIQTKPCGKSMLIGYLRNKLIDRQVAENAATEVLKDIDMTEQAVAALSKRWYRYEQFELEEAKKKSYTYLSRRGFGFEAAKKAFNILNETTIKD